MLNRSTAVNWYYIDRGRKAGPLADAQLDELVRVGQLTPDSLVWRDGMAEWQQYGRVRSVTAPAEPDGGTGRMSCALCSKSFAPDEVIAFEGAWVCAACKPKLVQRVREGLSVGLASGNAWRDGDLVVTTAGSTLTGRCVKCNGVESLTHLSRALYWHPPWVYALLLLTPVAYLVALLPMQKRALVTFSVCRHHRHRRVTQMTASCLFLFSAFGLGVASAAYSSLLLLVAGGTVLAIGGSVFRRQLMLLSAAKIEEDFIWLRGFGREFVDALPEFNRQRAMERRARADPPSRKP